MEKDYFVPFADFGEDKFEEKRSKFTGRLWHVETAEQAVAKIKEMRETFWDATHNCYAYILREGNVMRYSDDGEPQGTAGMPILEVLRHENLTDCVCVVTRYFGGILLGTGGLVRAYQGSVKLGLEGLPVTLREDMRRFVVSIEPHQVSDFQHFLAESRGRVQSSDFRFDATFEVLVPSDEADAFVERLSEATAGEALIDPIDEE